MLHMIDKSSRFNSASAEYFTSADVHLAFGWGMLYLGGGGVRMWNVHGLWRETIYN